MFRARDSAWCDGTRLVLRAAAAQCIQHNFNAARDSQLVEDSEEVVLYGVLPERQPMCDLAVGESLSHAAHYIKFARREESISTDAAEAHRQRFRDGFEQIVELAAASPDLTHMDAENALGEQLQRFGTKEDTARSGAEGLDYRGPLGRIEQHNHARGRRAGTNVAAQLEAGAVIAQPGADQGDMRVLSPGLGEDFGGLRRRARHGELSVARQRLDQHLRVHGGAVSGQDAYRVLRWKAGQWGHD